MSSPLGTGRTILSVIGPHSGCGKTLFVSWLLRHVEGLGCLKISPTHDGPEGVPAGDKSSGIRRQDFQLEDSALLNRPGKDTALYLRIGAVRVERLRPRGDGLARGLRAALQRFDRSTPIVVESSRAVALLRPAAVVMVVRPPVREMKPATRDALSLVTDLLISASDREESATGEAERLRQEFPALRPQFTWSADLICEPPPEQMLARLRSLLTPAGPGQG